MREMLENINHKTDFDEFWYRDRCGPGHGYIINNFRKLAH